MAKKKSASTPSVGRISGADEKKKALEVAMAHLEKRLRQRHSDAPG